VKGLIINEKENSVKLRISKNFYTEEDIKKACEDYGVVCSVKILSSSDEFVEVLLKSSDESTDISVLGLEFMNYLLGLSRGK
jgi:hypothetical protein